MILGIIKPRSVHYNFQSNTKYNFMRIVNHQCTLNDALNQSVIRDTSGQYLATAALNNLDDAGKWMSVSPSPPFISVFLLSFLLSKNKPSRFLALHNSSRIG